MIIKTEKNIFFVVSRYEEKDTIKDCGFRWNPSLKRWETTNYKVVLSLMKKIEGNPHHTVDSSVKMLIRSIMDKQKEVIKNSSKASSEIFIPAPSGMDYLPFQKAGVEFINSQKNVLLADEMGLGKTIQVIGFLNLHPEIKKVLIIVPATLKLNWLREIQKWDVNNRDVGILNGQFHDVTIMNYEMIVSNKNAEEKFQRLTSILWDLLVLDESHYIKNLKAQRTKRIIGYFKKSGDQKVWVKGLKDCARQKILLTGTPIMNRPLEIFSQLKVVGSPLAKNYNAFKNSYVISDEWGNQIETKNLDELNLKLRSSCMIRREKKDVLLELPDKIRQVIPIDILSESEKERQKTLIQAIYEWDPLSDQRFKDTIPVFEEMSKERHEFGIMKVSTVISLIEQTLENEEKVVVFVHHHDVANQIFERFKDISVIATGSESMEERDKAIKAFQNGDKRVMIASTLAMGVGITLTSAKVAIFAEVEWRPADLFQAEDRLHRIGQKDSVLILYPVVEGSIEAYMLNKIMSKQSVIEQIVKKTNPTYDTELVELLKNIREVKPTERDKEKTKQQPTKVEEEKAVPVIKALKLLSSYDGDHAREKKRMGFNLFDTDFGHILSMKTNLSQKQYELAYNIIKKYKREIPEIWEKIYGGE